MKTFGKIGLAGAMVVLAVSLSTAAAAEETTISVDFKDASIGQVADFVSVEAGVNIVVEKGVSGAVDLRLNDVPWLEALNIAAKQVGCTVEKGDDNIYYITTPHFSFTTKAEGVSLKQVISLLAQQSGQNIVVAPDVDAVVHFSLRDVPWQVALETIVKTAGPFAVVRDESSVYRVVKSDALAEQKETRVFKLKYIQPPSEYKPKITSEFAEKRSGDTSTGSRDLAEDFTLFKALNEVVADRGSVEFDFDSNAFIVTATRPILEEVAEIVRLVDIRPDQVFVDVKFVTTAHTDLLNAGVNFPNGLQISGSGGSVIHRLPFNLYKGGFEDSLSITGDSPTQADIDNFLDGESAYTFGVLDFSNVAPILEFLANDSESEIVQAPQLTVVDNKSATVFVGEQIHFAEEFSSSAQSGGVVRGIREATKNSPVKIGTQLLVMPHIVPETDKIVLSVIPTSEQLTGDSSPSVPGFERFQVADSFIDLPRMSSRTIVTTLILKDGQTAVLGGLINQSRTLNGNKLPFLGDVPILGWLFRNKQINNDINNLYIFISVRIIRDDADIQTLFAEYDVPGAHVKPYKRGHEVKSIEDELKEIARARKAEEEAAREAEKAAEEAAKKAAETSYKQESMKAPELGPDVVGAGWEESEHGVEEFVMKEE